MSNGRSRRLEPEEEHENHERWMVTYADMVTLLMVLFIVLFAMSQVDEKKFNALRSGLADGFGQSALLMDGSTSILDQPGTAAVESISPLVADTGRPQVDQAAVAEAVTENERLRAQRQYAEVQAEESRLDEIRRRLMEALRRKSLEGDVVASIDERGLTISLVSKHVVFESNMATLTARGRLIVDTLAPALAELPDPLEIDGHTNQVKVKPKYYPTDWELSSARAITVLRRLNERNRISADRLSAVGFGHTKPLRDPRKPGSQKVNKRVDIVVASRLLPGRGALLGRVVSEQAAQHARKRSTQQKGSS